MIFPNELCEHFGVGVGRERDTLADESVAQFGMILHDAIMDDPDGLCGVGMRVGILFGRRAVGRPTGVRDASGRLKLLRQGIGKFFNFPGALHDTFPREVNARRIIAAVFERPQAVHKKRRRILFSDVSDDATHTSVITHFRKGK